jgi:predicted component of type VI protein secretion system
MATPKQEYIKQLNDIAYRYGMLEDTTIRHAMTMLGDLRAQIADQLTAAQGWEAYRLRELQVGVERAILDYESRLNGRLRPAFEQAHQDGQAMVVDPLRRLGIQSVFFQPNPAQVNVLLDFSAELVKGIGNDLRTRINAQIRRAALGQMSPMDAMKAITQELGVKAQAGMWARRPPVVRGVAARAETIVRTEMQRVFNLANHSQQLATAKQVPGLMKAWIATADGRTRQSHLQAHVQYRGNPIPVNQLFVLHDAKYGKAELMFPADPAAPPWATINCRCRTATIHPAIGVIGSSLDGRISQELQRRSA